MEMKLTTIGVIAIIITTLVMEHHFLLMVSAISHHRTVAANATSMTGFSFRLGTNEHNIRRGSDGFLHLLLQHKPLVENNNTLQPETQPPPVHIEHDVTVLVGTGPGQHEYKLKLDTSSSLTWLQCKPCQPQAKQHGPIFDGGASPTFESVASTSPNCKPPFEHGPLCAFHIAGPAHFAVHGYAAIDHISRKDHAHERSLFGCSQSTENFHNNDIYAGVLAASRAPTSFVMQAGFTRFSYCLFAVSGKSTTNGREGFIRFGTHIPRNPHYRTTSILPSLNAHEAEYYVSLVGISLGTRRLDAIRPEMFARRENGQGGCMIDLGTPLTMMVQEAYIVVEEAVWSDLQRHGAERVSRPSYGICFRATEEVKGRLPSLSLHFSEDDAVLVIAPEQLFLMMREDEDQQGMIACLALKPNRHRTVIGAMQQVDTRFVFDLKESKLSFASESCTQDTQAVAI